MSFINTTAACDYKLTCLGIAAQGNLPPEAQLAYAKDMFAWVVADHLQPEVVRRTTLGPITAPTTPYPTPFRVGDAFDPVLERLKADDATVERLTDALKKTYK